MKKAIIFLLLVGGTLGAYAQSAGHTKQVNAAEQRAKLQLAHTKGLQKGQKVNADKAQPVTVNSVTARKTAQPMAAKPVQGKLVKGQPVSANTASAKPAATDAQKAKQQKLDALKNAHTAKLQPGASLTTTTLVTGVKK